MNTHFGNLQKHPRATLSHLPTALEPMLNLSDHFGGANLFVKRDDCTGLAMGGNKARQLEYYIGKANAENADSVLITGAVQSNFVRLAAAAARKFNMKCHIQLEQRVKSKSELYHQSGNVLLSRMLAEKLYEYPDGEDERGADIKLDEIAADLKQEGNRPYVIHLGPDHPPLGALGYVQAAIEIAEQLKIHNLKLDGIVTPSGSGATHSGLLFGLRMIGVDIPVYGICVRREKSAQALRIEKLCDKIAVLLEMKNPVSTDDIKIHDEVLAPGYGKMNQFVEESIKLAAQKEGLLLDPVYTGKAMAGMIELIKNTKRNENYLFLHTGGQVANFGYADMLENILIPRD